MRSYTPAFVLLSLLAVLCAAPSCGAQIPGLVGDGVHDDAPAIQAALDAAGTASSPNGDTIELPRGKFRCASTLHIRRRLVLRGSGGDPSFPATDLIFDDGVPGIVVDKSSTGAGGGSGDWSIIENLRLICAGKTVPDIDGIRLHARCTIRNVSAHNWSRHGFNISAGGGLGPNGEKTNANCFQLAYLRATWCGGNGFHFEGSDANAGTIIGCDSTLNDGWGFSDESFLGNYFFGCHTSSNEGGAYRNTSNNHSGGFVMCYSEGGQPASHIIAPAMVLGGTQGAGFTPGSTGLILSGFTHGANVLGGDVVFKNSSGVRLIPTPKDTTQSAFVITSDDAPGHSWRFRRNSHSQYSGWWDLLAGNSVANSSLAFAEAGNAQGYRAGSVMARYGLYIGNLSQGVGRERLLTNSISSPTSGTWKAGDVAFNSLPSAAKPISHWVCVTSGTPGTWRAVGTGAGTTAQRPSLTAGDAGFTYFDRTLTKMIHWNGTTWDE